MTCVRCEQPIDDDELVDTRLGSMHEHCAQERYDSYETTDHGDSVWPK